MCMDPGAAKGRAEKREPHPVDALRRMRSKAGASQGGTKRNACDSKRPADSESADCE